MNKRHHGMRYTRIYVTWLNMKSRCNNPKNRYYQKYGGRGIKVCSEWDVDAAAFIAWAIANGYNDQLTIDRIDNNLGYCPENCRFVTRADQNRNMSRNVNIVIKGQTKTMAEWTRFFGISPRAVAYRIKNGWSPRDAVSVAKYKKAGGMATNEG